MAFSTGGGSGPMAEINVTPLVDVMLVLLIIFMITAPLMTHKIRIDLPQATNNKTEENPLEMPRARNLAGAERSDEDVAFPFREPIPCVECHPRNRDGGHPVEVRQGGVSRRRCLRSPR